MPFCPVEWPSIGIGQLVSAAKNNKLDAKAIYASLRFAKSINFATYNLIASIIQPESLLAEWFFSGSAFEDYEFPKGDFLSRTVSNESSYAKFAYMAFKENSLFLTDEFKKVRKTAEQFVEKIAWEIVEKKPTIVGCSSSYMQYTSSLALLCKIKKLSPGIVTMIGGANCEGEMGNIIKKNFSWVDFVVSGEADEIFPDLCKKIMEKGNNLSLEEIPFGVYSKEKLMAKSNGTGKLFTETALVKQMDNIPLPDYSAYFETIKKTGIDKFFEPYLMMETSRGCWKGYKSPCNFCGLNGSRSFYRSKSHERVLKDLETLSSTYGINSFFMTDTILNMSYFKNLFKELKAIDRSYHIFFETRSKLSEDQVKQLSDAGVCWIQPGIESLHDEILKLINKNTSAIDSIATLKYGLENGVRINWNILGGIPEDKDEYYQEMANILPLFFHLEPPFFLNIRFERFSVYYDHPERYGLTLSPLKNYKYVVPFKGNDLEKGVIFFEDREGLMNQKLDKPGVKKLQKVISEWRIRFHCKSDNFNQPELLISENGNKTIILDTRPCATSYKHILGGTESSIYKACRNPITKKGLFNFLISGSSDKNLNDDCTLEKDLKNLISKKLLLQHNGRYLSLANFKPRKKYTVGTTNEIMTKYILQNTIPASKPQENVLWDWFEKIEL